MLKIIFFLLAIFPSFFSCECANYDIYEIDDAEYQTVGFEINDNGEVIGAFIDDNNKVKGGFLWSYSEKSLISLFRNQNETYPISINNKSEIIGYGYTNSGRWKLDSNGITSLLDKQGKAIVKINNKGNILESAHTYANYPGYKEIQYNDFNDNGIRIGHYYFGKKRIVFEGKISNNYGIGTAINNNDTYVGHFFPEKEESSDVKFQKNFSLILPRLESEIPRDSHAFISSKDHIFTPIETDKIASYATDVNDLNAVVGYYFIEEGNIFKKTSTRAFFYNDGQMIDLNEQISQINKKKITLLAATSINNNGMILCFGIIDTKYKTFILVPK